MRVNPLGLFRRRVTQVTAFALVGMGPRVFPCGRVGVG
jgi:hypothetical protein